MNKNFGTLVEILFTQPKKRTVMIDLKEQYEKAKKKAKELMAKGRVNEYIWQLAEVRRLQIQLKQFAR